MPTNVELGVKCNSLEDKFQQLMSTLSTLPTKDDLNKLATKDDLSELVTKKDLSSFEENFTTKINADLDTRFTKFKAEQKLITDDISLRTRNTDAKLEKKLSEINAERLLEKKYNFRCNVLLLGEPEQEKKGQWKETPKDCLKKVNKHLDKILPGGSSTIS